MDGIKIVAFVIFLWGFHLCAVQCKNCEILENYFGQRPHGVLSSNGEFYDSEMCWKIEVPRNYMIILIIGRMQSNLSCGDDYVRITVAETSEVYQFCSSNFSKNPITAIGNVTVTHFRRENYSSSSFEIQYVFRREELFAEKLSKLKDDLITWLIQKRTSEWGWKENTPRAVVTLYLASAASFNGTVLEEELMAKETELQIAIALLRPYLTNSELSMFIHALLVTCHDPRHFYGMDLVQRLKRQVEETGNHTHPLAYLALCNADEPWPRGAVSQLNSTLVRDSEYPFVTDLQAIAFMALVCEEKGITNFPEDLSHSVIMWQENLNNLADPGENIGNVYTMALLTQAFTSFSEGRDAEWTRQAAAMLKKNLDNSSLDFLAAYLVLPVLNGKNLVDISRVNCSAHPRKHGSDSEMGNNPRPKIRVQYSLYIGDEKDIAHTISFRVPENVTAFEVMKLAAVENPKYKFEYKMMSEKMYVYGIANVRSDPEAGKFWLLYMSTSKSSEQLTHLTKGPDKVIIGNGEHLFWWYKTATI